MRSRGDTARPVLAEWSAVIAVVTINRPQKRNAINADVVDALENALVEPEGDPSIERPLPSGGGCLAPGEE